MAESRENRKGLIVPEMAGTMLTPQTRSRFIHPARTPTTASIETTCTYMYEWYNGMAKCMVVNATAQLYCAKMHRSHLG